MYYVYILKSIESKRTYIGITDNIKRRLHFHNQGWSKSTKPFRPWILIYKETVESRHDARTREIYLKSGQGREWIKSQPWF